MYQASQSYAVNKASSSCFETSRHKSNKKCVPDKISQVLKYQYLPNKKGKLFVSGQTSKEFMPVSVQSVSLLYCTSPIPKPSCELGMRRTFQKHIRNLSPSQPAQLMKPVMQRVGAKFRLEGISWPVQYATHMTVSTAYKLISGSHGHHTPTMFGAHTIPAELREAAVWLCRVKQLYGCVKLHKEGIPCVLEYLLFSSRRL